MFFYTSSRHLSVFCYFFRGPNRTGLSEHGIVPGTLPCCVLPFPFALPSRFSSGLSYYPPATSAMSQNSTDAPSRSNYQAIFDSALDAYKEKTGQDLTSNPLLRSFETCHSPDAILAMLKAQIIEPGQSQNRGDKLLTWLNPTINVLIAFSAAIGGSVGQVSLEAFKVTRQDMQSDLHLRHIHPSEWFLQA